MQFCWNFSRGNLSFGRTQQQQEKSERNDGQGKTTSLYKCQGHNSLSYLTFSISDANYHKLLQYVFMTTYSESVSFRNRATQVSKAAKSRRRLVVYPMQCDHTYTQGFARRLPPPKELTMASMFLSLRARSSPFLTLMRFLSSNLRANLTWSRCQHRKNITQ